MAGRIPGGVGHGAGKRLRDVIRGAGAASERWNRGLVDVGAAGEQSLGGGSGYSGADVRSAPVRTPHVRSASRSATDVRSANVHHAPLRPDGRSHG